jgi:hypothetical protein
VTCRLNQQKAAKYRCTWMRTLRQRGRAGRTLREATHPMSEPAVMPFQSEDRLMNCVDCFPLSVRTREMPLPICLSLVVVAKRRLFCFRAGALASVPDEIEPSRDYGCFRFSLNHTVITPHSIHAPHFRSQGSQPPLPLKKPLNHTYLF